MSAPAPQANGRPGVEAMIARLLFTGGLLGVAIVVAGLVTFAIGGGFRGPALSVDHAAGAAAPGVFVSLAEIRRALGGHPPDPLAIVDVGLLCLLGTPVAGTAVAVVAFLAARDRRYAAIAGIVLAMLVAGALVSGGAG